MKIRICLKDPDGVSDAVQEAAEERLTKHNLDEEEREIMHDLYVKTVEKEMQPWVKWGEYVTIEIDTIAGTAVVVKQPA